MSIGYEKETQKSTNSRQGRTEVTMNSVQIIQGQVYQDKIGQFEEVSKVKDMNNHSFDPYTKEK